MKIAQHKVVTINYKLTDPKGQVIDTSEGREPLVYIHGGGNLIPGLESALEGKGAGDRIDVTIAPEHGYGLRNEELVQPVPRKSFPGVKVLEVGMQFRAQGPDGQRVVTVVSFGKDDEVMVDGNHPLAGMPLHFDVTVVTVRAATKEELDHGHVHGPGGHHHH
ncbi:MAG: peptidylprolyl isomerase [Planctomycetota bacterium]|nr:peptidylprolyl isomerase [Planctomycetota bacterium]